MMNADQTQSISAEREAMMKVFEELRVAKFYFPREWEVPSREHDPTPDFEAQPQRTQVGDTDEDIGRRSADATELHVRRRNIGSAGLVWKASCTDTAGVPKDRVAKLCRSGIQVHDGHG